jgi:hypothetical protein
LNPKKSNEMASDVGSNPQTAASAAESKSARKKKAKAGAAAVVPAAPEQNNSEFGAGGSDPAGKSNGADSEHSYVKELQKLVTACGSFKQSFH